MKSKKIVQFLTVVTTILSLYYLSFTVVDYRIQRQAEQYATDREGKIVFDQLQTYLSNIWKKPVYHLLGSAYTYEEVKERSLKLGLDLQGGMHITMELSPIELIKGLASYPNDPAFNEALALAQMEREQGSATPFSKLFIAAYKRLSPTQELKDLFHIASNQSRPYSFSNEQAIAKAIDKEIAFALERSRTVIETRLDRFGTTQPVIQQLPGSNKILIELPGVTQPERVRKLLEGVAQLRFWEVAEAEEYAAALETVDRFLLQQEKETIVKNKAKTLAEIETEQPIPTASILKRLSQGRFPYTLAYASSDMAQIETLLADKQIQALLPKQIIWMWDKKGHTLPDNNEAFMLYAIKQSKTHQPLLEGDIISYAAQAFNEQGTPVVNMQMHAQGARRWKQLTAANIGKRIAIALDNRVYSAPVVNQEIPNGHSQISGNFTIEEAKDLASILQTGSLPAPLKIVEEAIMGPSLGKTAQNQGIIATVAGLAIVLLFMIAYYARAGMIANLALLFNLLFVVGILAQLEATLTLPGIAGLVLTIGMSIDANVLIFERIREELAQNIHIKEAIRRGYDKSYSSIMDANITTLLVGSILYHLGQGQVRSFAIILMIGIASALFSSICITRWIFAIFMERYRTPNITFSYGTIPLFFKSGNLNFIQNRYRFYAFSFCFIMLGGGCFLKNKGLTWGIDFAGGRCYIVHFSQPIDASALKEKLSSSLQEGVEVRSYGANNIMRITTSYLQEAHASIADQKVQSQLMTALGHVQGNSFEIISSSKVGATVAHEVQRSAQKAIILSLLGILFYMVLRFRKWRFGLAAIVALIHDVLAVIAGFCIARTLGVNYEINEVFLAAILTVIGYSINDTVVIFDRIREKANHKMEDLSLDMVNQAIRDTLSRTMITSLTTLLVVLILFIFGGEALRGFSFALLLGILFGTYSSICIATPLLVDFRSKQASSKVDR